MFNNFKDFIFSLKFTKLSLVIYCFVAVILSVLLLMHSSTIVGNNDGYLTLFGQYLKNGWYLENVNGTTPVYYFILSTLYDVFGSTQISFFVLNLTSQLFIIFFGLYMLWKIKSKNDNLFISIILILYFSRSLILELFNKASNDAFLAVFIMVIFHLLINYIFEIKKRNNILLIIVGVFLAISLGIRLTAIFLIPIIIMILILWKFKHHNSWLTLIKSVILIAFSFSFFTAIIHYPSLKERGKLSFYDKNPSNGLNWTQRNYLAFIKIEENGKKFTHGNVWSTNFSDVENYLKINGNNSLPKNLIEVLKYNPILYFKIVTLNLTMTFFWFLRFLGLLFLLPLIMMFKNKKFIIGNIPYLSIILIILMLLVVVFGIIEFRWFLGYEILMYMAVIISLKSINWIEQKWLNIIFSFSLILITLFNIRSIIITYFI